MKTPLERAKMLRRGIPLSHCDSLLVFKGGQFAESNMGFNGEVHAFDERRPSWLEVRRWIKSGAYH